MWKYHSVNINIFYFFIIGSLIVGMCVDIFIKKNKIYDDKYILLSQLLMTFGVLLLTIHHYVNTNWLFGFSIVLVLLLINLYSCYNLYINYLKYKIR